MTTGSYYKKNGHHFLIYDEATEGFDMMTHNMIKFTETPSRCASAASLMSI